MLLTIAAFILALGVLIAVHEYGHYRTAVACGVKVLRFSVGFGKPLLRWQPKNSPTEFVIGAIPLGGYVRMLDEREAPVAAEERHLAFNTQPLRSRAAIVAAGPIANLLLAILLYAIVSWTGVQEPKAYLSSPAPGSLAQLAGVRGGELAVAAAMDQGEMQPLESFDSLRWLLTKAAMDRSTLRLQLQDPATTRSHEVQLHLAEMQQAEPDAQMFQKIGIVAPYTKPVLGTLVAGGAAERSGLKAGDVVTQVGATAVVDGQQLRGLIRDSVHAGKALAQDWTIERAGQVQHINVLPEVQNETSGAAIARIGAYVGLPPEFVLVRHGPLEGLWSGVVRTWDVSILSLRMMGRMVTGQASLKNLSGPLTIADYAGRSASMGLSQYLVFLALISVSLGVLNLLPLPVLDGGHLMYYLWEGVTGRTVSDAWMDKLQRGGVALLLVMMSIALFNDVTRLFG